MSASWNAELEEVGEEGEMGEGQDSEGGGDGGEQESGINSTFNTVTGFKGPKLDVTRAM